MSIIQRIREKGALISAIVIALALLGFIAMDAFTGRSNLFGGSRSNTLGNVNGESIDINDFRQMVDAVEQNMRSQGYPAGPALSQQAIENAWNQEVNRIVQEQEMDKLGFTLSKKEVSDLLYGPNPSAIAKQYMGGPEGQYNPEQVKQTIRQIERGRNNEQKQQLAQLLKYIEQTRLTEKFSSLFAGSVNVPAWKIEKENADNSQVATISLVRKSYTEIPDSTVTISDKEISDYINKNKEEFKQKESRSISYVSFSAAPSPADTAAVISKLVALKEEMLNSQDIERFLMREGQPGFYNSYISGSRVQIAAKDSIFRTPVGQVYGPYADGGGYSLAKLLGARQMPDTVKVRHILIATMQQDPQSGQQMMVRDSATAYKLIDSIQGLIRGGAIFDSVCAQLSEDPGSKDKGGVYDNVPSGQMVPTFNDFIFTNPVGSKGIVKTEYGYHYVEVLSQKGNSMAYKVAYLSKPVLTSTDTDSEARNAASQFAGSCKDEKTFNESFEKTLKPKGYNKGIAYDILPNSYDVMGLGVSRDFVRKIYEADRNEVLQPERVDDNYVVAVVTEVNKEGLVPVAKARQRVEPLLRNKKKAELIKKEIGNITTLEAVAGKWGKTVEVVDSVRMTGAQTSPAAQTIGYEQKVIGAAFNAANRGKLVPEAIEGSGAVFVVRVDNVMAVAQATGSVQEQRKAEMERAKQQAAYNSPVTYLREAAKIKDNRSTHY